MWNWFEHYGMALGYLALGLAVASVVYGVYLKKNSPKRGRSSSKDWADIFLKAGALLALIAVLLIIESAVAIQKNQVLKADGSFSFGSGWVFYGYYDQAGKKFLSGPFEKILPRNEASVGDKNIPQKGDLLEVLKTSKVYIPFYQQTGSTHQFDAPITYKTRIEPRDETGMVLRPKTRLSVKDVVWKNFGPMNGISIWARVKRFNPNAQPEGTVTPQTPAEKKQ